MQVIYNIFDQTPGTESVSGYQQHNVGVLHECPLDEGALTGTITNGLTLTDMNFARFTFWATVRVRSDSTSPRSGQTWRAYRRLAARARLAILPLASCCIHRHSRHAQGPERGIELSRLEPAIGGGLATGAEKHAWNKNYYS